MNGLPSTKHGIQRLRLEGALQNDALLSNEQALDFDDGIPVSWLYIQSSRALGGFDSAVIAKGAHLHQQSVVPRPAIAKPAASDSEHYRNK